MTVYISGPMTGIPDHNFPAFDSLAADLISRGYEVVNPADIARKLRSDLGTYGLEPPRAAYLSADISALIGCDTIFLLPGWQASEGALLEYTLARALGMEILHE
jgi:hypothetical protein